MACFATELLKFGVAIDEYSQTDKAAVCCLDLFSINKVISKQDVTKNFWSCKLQTIIFLKVSVLFLSEKCY